MTMNQSIPTLICRTAALTFFAVSLPLSLQAQQAPLVALLDQPALFSLASTAAAPLNLTEDGIAYSSSTGSAELAAAESYVTSTDATQPPPRRRYGRPNYSDKMHNADGSNKIAFVVGGGFTAPVFNPSTKYLKTSWKIQTGVGYNFNKKFGVILQFDYDNFALPGSLIASQTTVYNSQGFTDQNGNPIDFTGLDGHAHDWSFTLNPTYNFYQGDKTGAYAVVGGGFYHKVTDFTLPEQGEYFDPYYGLITYEANQTFDQYVSNAAGVNGGIGFTYKPSRFASERLYAEARYVFNFNSQRPGNNTTNFFPGNSATTSYVPVTVGIRF